MKKPGGFPSITAIALFFFCGQAYAQIPCWLPVLWSASTNSSGVLDFSVVQEEWGQHRDGATPAIAFWEGQPYQLWDNSVAGEDAQARAALPLRFTQQASAHPFEPHRVISLAVDSITPSLPFIYAVQDNGEMYYLTPPDYHSPSASHWTRPARAYSPAVSADYRVHRFGYHPVLELDEQIQTVKTFQQDGEHYLFLQTNLGRFFRGKLEWSSSEEPVIVDFEDSEPQVPTGGPGEVEGVFQPAADDVLPFRSRSVFCPISAEEVVTISSDGVLSVLSSHAKQEIMALFHAFPISLSAYLLPAETVGTSVLSERLVVWAILEDAQEQRRLIRWQGNDYENFQAIELPPGARPFTVSAALARKPLRESPSFFHPIGEYGWGERVIIGGLDEDIFLQQNYQAWGIGRDGKALSVNWLIPHHHRVPTTSEFRVNEFLPNIPSLVKLFDEREVIAENWLTNHFKYQSDPIFRLASLPHFLDANRRRLMLRAAFGRVQTQLSGRFYTELQHHGVNSLDALHFAHEFLFQGGQLENGIFPDRISDISVAVSLLTAPARTIFAAQRMPAGTRGSYSDAVYLASEWTLNKISERYHLDRRDLDRWIIKDVAANRADGRVWEYLEQLLRQLDPLRAIVSRETLFTILGDTPSSLP